MTIHNVIYSRLRTAGYEAADAKAIIWTAKAVRSCVHARKWWTAEAGLYSAANIEVLWENVRKIAAKYALTFITRPTQFRGKLTELDLQLLQETYRVLTAN